MRSELETSPIPVRYEHLLKLISSERFLKMQGLGNEVPFFICPFSPEETNEFNGIQKQLKNKLAGEGIRVLALNLYDLSIEILKARGIWDQVLEMEATTSKDELKELLQNVLDSQAHLVPAIAEKMRAEEFDVMFIGGVGEVFPYIRSHNVLNNLQSAAKDHPTVMFFPGQYSHSIDGGVSLNLFNRLLDDKYYRAFNIFHCEI